MTCRNQPLPFNFLFMAFTSLSNWILLGQLAQSATGNFTYSIVDSATYIFECHNIAVFIFGYKPNVLFQYFPDNHMHFFNFFKEVFLVFALKNKVLSTTTQSVSFLNLLLTIKITDTTVFTQISAMVLTDMYM